MPFYYYMSVLNLLSVFAWFMQGASQVLYLKAKLRRPTIGS